MGLTADYFKRHVREPHPALAFGTGESGGNVIGHEGRAGSLRNVNRGTGTGDSFPAPQIIYNNLGFYYINLKFQAQ
ncbi:MAG: hypothetical protein QGF67_02365 [Lentisphaeria bacterium]|jgi:hypothetical protein|nr:hypothetical protein [Lentisphaeria bacterium]MDP7740256.1 hypothetical protein [Lentisphaeria bacterium]